jgi:ATP-dependent protease ClpP protease subunit
MLACSGTNGHRFISENTTHLCHLGSGGVYAKNDIELERQSDFLKEHFNFVRKTYKKYAKIPDLNKIIKDDSLYITGQKIIDWGLADKFY